MTACQKVRLRAFLQRLWDDEGYRVFIHGDCIGADAQAARIAKDIGYYLICLPGHPKDKTNTMFRAFTDFNDEVREPKPFIARDHDIVNESDLLVATPVGEEEIRSGTWTTIRYARKKKKPIEIIMPPIKLNRYLTGEE